MAKRGGGLAGVVVLAAVLGFGYYFFGRTGDSVTPPDPPGSTSGQGTGRYVALGDSYTSAPRTGNAAGGPAGCARSDNNYPHRIAAAQQPKSFVDVSCAGATTANLTGAQRTAGGTNPPQLDAVTADTTLVTVGIGGNDIGFFGFADDCASASPTGSPCRDRFTAGGTDQLAARIQRTAPVIAGLLDRVHRKAPKARVLLVGYPAVLPDGDGCWPVLPYGSPDVAYLRDTLAGLNDMLAAQAKAHAAGFADTAAPGSGHDVCTAADTRWVEGLVPTSRAIPLHPNARGEQGMADAVLRLL